MLRLEQEIPGLYSDSWFIQFTQLCNIFYIFFYLIKYFDISVCPTSMYTKQGRWILLRFRIIEHRFSNKWFKIMYTLHRMNFHQSYSSFKGMFPKVVCKDFWWFLIRKLRVLKSLLLWFLHIESEFLWVVLPWLLTEWGRKLYFRIAWLYWTRDILFWIKTAWIPYIWTSHQL